MLPLLKRRVLLGNLPLITISDPSLSCEIKEDFTWLNIKYHVHCLLPKRNHVVQSGQVEVIFDEVFANFTEVFMARKRAEPADPRQR